MTDAKPLPFDPENPFRDPQTAIEYTAHCLGQDIDRLSGAASDPTTRAHVRDQADAILSALADLNALAMKLRQSDG